MHLAPATSRVTDPDELVEGDDAVPTPTLLEDPDVAPPVTAHQLSTQRTLSRDFYSSMQVNQDTCFGEAMQVIEDDRIIDPIPQGTEEIDRIDRLSQEIMRWASGWDGVAYWPVTLDYLFTSAVEEGQEKQWWEQLLGHASKGWRLLAQLYSMGGSLLKEQYKVRELWRLQVGLIEILVMGIMTINIRCSILPHHWNVKKLPLAACSSESDAESSDGNSVIHSEDTDEEDSN